MKALVLPAKIALRYEPDEASDLTYAQAVRLVVGLTHVEPPTPWDKASELDALAESVLDELVRSRRIEPDDARYLGGDLTPQEAGDLGWGRLPDELSAHVLHILLKGHLGVTKRGIRRVTAQARVRRTTAVVAAELGLRTWRSTLDRSQASQVDAVRSASQRCLRMGEIGDKPWEVSGRDAERLRRAALDELAEGVTAGPAAVELAVLASWYLLTHAQMRRELTSSHDKRSLDKVLRMLMTTPRGVSQLAQALADGRQGQRARRVNEEGTPLADGTPVDDDWVRRTWSESTGTDADVDLDEDQTHTPEDELRATQDRVAELVARLDTAVDAVKLVQGARRPLVIERGWPSDEVGRLIDVMDKATRELRTWAAIFDAGAVAREPAAN